ncbi:hypothetical protein [Pseudooceanicola marinus]|uniref:hypothetical protein n=1 Tax=Pseudooceanicola marinus TaxID=396013 RepID=UPI001CD71E5E|nr:hypothetical protein [Pseudooceanicola marinus]MCA1337355.1 hypothetical protein [Pseudooceanicola marinus]
MEVLGSIGVRIGAEDDGLRRGVNRSRKSVAEMERDMLRMGARVAKVGVAITAGLTAAGASAIYMTRNAAAAGTEIARLSRRAGASSTEFQKMSAAVATVGIDGAELSDILKDVNDRFGDFMATGAGPIADFFENIAPRVGVTAEQFARLSGPEALQLYVSSLEKAGVSQQQMTFYMEALASNATDLLPLLRNGGVELRRLGDEAEKAGRILDKDAVAGAAELDRKMKGLSTTIKTQLTQAILDNSEEISDLVDQVSEVWLPALIQVADTITKILAGSEKYVNLASSLMDVRNYKPAEYSDEEGGRIQDLMNDPRLGANGGTSTGSRVVDPKTGEIIEYGTGDGVPKVENVTIPPAPTVPLTRDPDVKSSGGGGGTDYQSELDALRENLATERELIEMDYEEKLEQLAVFREKKLASEEEFNDLERRAAEEHTEALASLDRKLRDQKLAAYSGMFGDLATLMNTENKKMFQVGKVAAIAQATLEGYSAAVTAWDKGMRVGGPPVAAAFSAASILKTGALISQIQSTQLGGAGGGGSGGAASGAAAQPSGGGLAGGSPVRVSWDGIDPDQLYRGSQIRGTLRELSEEAGDRGITFGEGY